MSEIPDVKPVKFKEFECKQSKYEMVGKLPTRAIICGPSGSGKTVLLQSMILDIYIEVVFLGYIFLVLLYMLIILGYLLKSSFQKK